MKKILIVLVILIGCNDSFDIKPERAIKFPNVQSSSDYDRSKWGRWIDEDGDCQDTRQEVLIEESLNEVEFETDKKCRVSSGRWIGLFSGEEFKNPSNLDVDHMVPLKVAHDDGGASWSKERKNNYFNDLENSRHLIAVSASENRSKGARKPNEWMPSNKNYHCQYIMDWMMVKGKWGLKVDNEEAKFIINYYIENCT